MSEEKNIEIYNETKTQMPSLRFLDIKNEILGEDYDLTISILKPESAEKINKKQRQKDYVPNTLSFIYSPKSGEIILTPSIIQSEMCDYDNDFETHVLFLFIHSTLHLLGHDHSDEMEKLEQKYLKQFKN